MREPKCPADDGAEAVVKDRHFFRAFRNGEPAMVQMNACVFVFEDGAPVCTPVMQCTGLRDRDGRLIWEGDVVVYPNGKTRAVVLWHGAAWCYQLECEYGTKFGIFRAAEGDWCEAVRVVGNINAEGGDKHGKAENDPAHDRPKQD